MSRIYKVDIPQLLQGFQRAYIAQNFGAIPENVYLPDGMYQMVTEYIDDQMISGGIPAELLEDVVQRTFLGMTIRRAFGYDVTVTRDELP